MKTLGAIVLALAVSPAIAWGQSVRGVVSDAATAAPLPGVVVTLLDNSGAAAGRALSNEQGEYRIIAPGAGTYRLRALRIGFSPVTSAPIALVLGGDAVHQLALTGIPFSLDTVRVAGQGSCDVRPDSARQTFHLWEQARAALTATQITERAGAITARVVSYERALEPQRERVTRQDVRIQTGATRTPFRAVSLDSLRRAGYVVQEVDGTTTYFAPDLGILLSDEFSGSHCMRVVTDRDPSRIGIAFEPVRERRRIPEIEGTLWLDRRTSELRLMEFRYVNVTRDQAAGNAGGELRFARMGNGAWVISGWNIRMPVIQSEMRRRFGGGFDPVVSVRELRVEGGELAMATRARGGDTLWARPPMGMQGVVTDSTSGLAIARALVTVRGTGRSARTDSAGRFVVGDMLPGEYTLDVASPALERLSMSYPVPVTFIDGRTAVAAKLPPAGLLTQRVCPDTLSGVLSGAVLPRDSVAPLGNARVTAEWLDRGDSSGTPRARWLEGRPDARGRYVICGLPVRTALEVRADGDSGSATPLRVTIDPERRIVGADFRLDQATRDATLFGTVISAVNGQPLPDVEVVIPALNRNTFTNSQGAFRLRGVPPGTHQVTVRRVGYTAVTQTVTLVSSQSLERQLVLSTVPTLAAVEVQASITMRTFEEHRALGLGHFLTRVELDAFVDRPLLAVLAQAPRAGVALGRGNLAAILSRRVMPTGRELSGDGTLPEGYFCPGRGLPCACYAQVYVDGHLMNRGDPTPEYNINEWSADRIEAIEWYSGRADTPIKYLSNQRVNCGVLVIHTRRYEPKKDP